LHELGHSWFPIEPTSKKYFYKIFIDLVAICAFKEIVPHHKRVYRDTLNKRSYIGIIGLKDMLNDPEKSLKEITKKITNAK